MPGRANPPSSMVAITLRLRHLAASYAEHIRYYGREN